MDRIERVKAAIKLKKVDKIPVFYELAGETDVKEFYIEPPGNWKPEKYSSFIFDVEDYIQEKYEKKEDEF